MLHISTAHPISIMLRRERKTYMVNERVYNSCNLQKQNHHRYYFQIILFYPIHVYSLLAHGKNVTISTIGNRKNGAVEQFTASSSKCSIVTSVMVNLGLGQHSKVFYFRTTEWWAVGGNENQFCLGFTQSLDGSLVAENGFSGLHDKFDTWVDGINGFLKREKKVSIEKKIAKLVFQIEMNQGGASLENNFWNMVCLVCYWLVLCHSSVDSFSIFDLVQLILKPLDFDTHATTSSPHSTAARRCTVSYTDQVYSAKRECFTETELMDSNKTPPFPSPVT